MNKQFKTILLFGPPGVGKGTQGKILGSMPNMFHLATGDMFRSLDKNSEIGRECTTYSSQGKLVPDELTIKLWHQHMNKLMETEKYNPDIDLLVLDGLPRSSKQVMLTKDFLCIKKILYLSCNNMEEMIKRMQKRAIEENRVDDADEQIIRKRFDVYENESRPVLEMFDSSLISKIDALKTPDEVSKSILKVIF